MTGRAGAVLVLPLPTFSYSWQIFYLINARYTHRLNLLSHKI